MWPNTRTPPPVCNQVFYYYLQLHYLNNLVVLYLLTSASARNKVYSTLLLLLLLAVWSIRSLLYFYATSIYYWPSALLHCQSSTATLFCLRLPLPVVLAYPFWEYKLLYIFSPTNFLCSLHTLPSI
jgi:hypothetical protein